MMKIKNILLTTLCVLTFSTFAQKDELKKLKKLYEKDSPSPDEAAEYKKLTAQLKSIATDETDKYYTTFYEAVIPVIKLKSSGLTPSPMQLKEALSTSSVAAFTNGLNATLDFEKKSGKKVFTDDIQKMITTYKPFIINAAISYGNEKKNKEAGELLYNVYQLDKADPEKLYYASSYLINGKEYDKALEYLYELKKINFSGQGVSYLAKNKATGIDESFKTEKEREIYIKAGTHEQPTNEEIPSKKGEIYRNIALILLDKGDMEAAKSAVLEARKENPDDMGLLLTEADFYLKVNDYDNYKKLANQALAKEPTNHVLLFNLGVTSANSNNIEDAVKYYKKAIELKPDYFDSYINLSEIMLRGDEKYVEEMNKLGNSEKDNKRYAVIKADREKNFKAILPYLEKAVELKPDNDPASRTLMSVYNALEMTDKYKALKAKLKN